MSAIYRNDIQFASCCSGVAVIETTAPFTTSLTVESSIIRRTGTYDGSFIFLHGRLRNSNSGAFTNGRTSVGTIKSDYLPVANVFIPISASTAVNGVLNRTAYLIITTSGSVSIDTVNSDIKQFQFSACYMGAGITV